MDVVGQREAVRTKPKPKPGLPAPAKLPKPAHLRADWQATRYVPPHVKHDEYVASLYAKQAALANTAEAAMRKQQEAAEREQPALPAEDAPFLKGKLRPTAREQQEGERPVGGTAGAVAGSRAPGVGARHPHDTAPAMVVPNGTLEAPFSIAQSDAFPRRVVAHCSTTAAAAETRAELRSRIQAASVVIVKEDEHAPGVVPTQQQDVGTRVAPLADKMQPPLAPLAKASELKRQHGHNPAHTAALAMPPGARPRLRNSRLIAQSKRVPTQSLRAQGTQQDTTGGASKKSNASPALRPDPGQRLDENSADDATYESRRQQMLPAAATTSTNTTSQPPQGWILQALDWGRWFGAGSGSKPSGSGSGCGGGKGGDLAIAPAKFEGTFNVSESAASPTSRAAHAMPMIADTEGASGCSFEGRVHSSPESHQGHHRHERRYAQSPAPPHQHQRCSPQAPSNQSSNPKSTAAAPLPPARSHPQPAVPAAPLDGVIVTREMRQIVAAEMMPDRDRQTLGRTTDSHEPPKATTPLAAPAARVPLSAFFEAFSAQRAQEPSYRTTEKADRVKRRDRGEHGREATLPAVEHRPTPPAPPSDDEQPALADAAISIAPVPRPHAFDIIAGLIRGGGGGGSHDNDNEDNEIREMRDELKRARASLPIHLRGRLPPPPPARNPQFLGDYGQRAGHQHQHFHRHRSQHSSYTASRSTMSLLRSAASSGTSYAASFRRRNGGGHGNGGRPVTDWTAAVAEAEAFIAAEGVAGACGKNLGAVEDRAPKGQAHAGEEGRAVAARAVMLSVRPAIDEGHENMIAANTPLPSE